MCEHLSPRFYRVEMVGNGNTKKARPLLFLPPAGSQCGNFNLYLPTIEQAAPPGFSYMAHQYTILLIHPSSAWIIFLCGSNAPANGRGATSALIACKSYYQKSIIHPTSRGSNIANRNLFNKCNNDGALGCWFVTFVQHPCH